MDRVSLPPFHTLIDEHGPALRRHLVGLVGVADADDVVQDTFVSALRAYPDLAPDANVVAWLWTIARNKAIDRYRADGRRPPPAPLVGDRPAPAEPSEPDDDLWSAVRRLPEGQRVAVTLRFVDDLPYARIAELCGCSVGAARQRVHDGLRSLRQEVTR